MAVLGVIICAVAEGSSKDLLKELRGQVGWIRHGA
jgi:hypothetical protein